MNEDLIKTPRYEFYLGDEVFLKGKIVGYDVDENKYVENVVRLEYGQTLNVPNSNIYTTDNIIDKCKIKVKVPQYVAEYINLQKKNNFHVYGAMRVIEDHYDKKVPEWFYGKNIETFVRAWLDGYEVEKEKRYVVSLKNGQPLVKSQSGNTFYFNQNITAGNYKVTRKQLEDAGFGWVLDCPGIELEEVE